MSAVHKAILLCSLMILLPHAHAVQIEPSQWNGSVVIEGGHSILVEEYTATWCSSCAEIDPDLGIVAEGHGSRISMVSYHPDDGVDAFSPEAAQHRIERLKIQHDSLGATPSFIVNNGEVREGVPSWPDVQADILKSESNQRQYTKLIVTAETNETHLIVTAMPPHPSEVDNQTQYTILFVQHKKVVGKAFENPGEAHRDRVLVGLAEFPMQGQQIAIDSNIEAPFVASYPTHDLSEWSVIVVHEYTEEALGNLSITDSQPLGVVEISLQSSVIENGAELPIILPIMIFLAIGILGVVSAQTKEKVREEE
ncbi:MAG: hypothetical protein QGG62_05580 [Candidatus Poseidoniaceae archaeon]|nr:hypothetical protein [Candidatus Poseidoniaceae archaeon]